MRDYLLGILCAAFLCALVGAIGGEGQGIRKLISGIFLALALLQPLGTLDLPELTMDVFRADAEEAVQSGTAQAESARTEFITEAVEAYILTKAAELGLEIQTQVTLDAEGLPASVTLTGWASPAEREDLIGSIARDLGLGKEALTWKELYQSSE